MTAEIVGIGLATVDYLAVVDALPAPDSKIWMERFAIEGGGPVATAMVTLARLGSRASFLGCLGGDDLGRVALEGLRAEGVDVSGVQIDPEGTTSLAMITVERGTGRRNVVARRGTLRPLAWGDALAERVRGAAALHVDGHEMAAQIAAAAEARAAGVPVFYDAGSVRERCGELLALTDWLVTSERFPRDFTGSAKLTRAMEKLLALGPRVVVTTLGARGCRYLDAEGSGEISGFAVEDPVDTTGAGDVYHGALISAALRGWPLARICAFANAAAALKCRALGGRTGVPSLAEVEGLLERSRKSGGE